MKTLRVLGIIGVVIAVLSFLCECMFNNYVDYSSAIGWGVISSFYLLAVSIVGIVKSKKQ
jgi:hypothetical protein